eukprot:11776357-Prorocentrum_lima.AAC.1
MPRKAKLSGKLRRSAQKNSTMISDPPAHCNFRVTKPPNRAEGADDAKAGAATARTAIHWNETGLLS